MPPRSQKAAEFNGRPVLVLVCGGGMMLFGLIPIVLAVQTAWSARRWIETPIEVVAVGLRQAETSELGAVLHEARGLYRYRVGGLTYTGSRIGVHLPAADNIGGWQQRWAEKLEAHDDFDAPLTAWVDPDHPERAVLDRSLRWGLLLFHACFVAVPAWPVYLAARASLGMTEGRSRARVRGR